MRTTLSDPERKNSIRRSIRKEFAMARQRGEKSHTITLSADDARLMGFRTLQLWFCDEEPLETAW